MAEPSAAARVRLERPSLRRQREFLHAVRRSRRLHGRWVAAPASAPAYRAFLAHARRPAHAAYFVIRRDTRALAGVISVSEIVRGNLQSAYLGYYAFTPHTGHGLMREALAQVLDLAFTRLRLHRVEANIQPDNLPSTRLVQALNFRLEGLSLRYLKIAGAWRDHHRWAMTSEEWRSTRRPRDE